MTHEDILSKTEVALYRGYLQSLEDSKFLIKITPQLRDELFKHADVVATSCDNTLRVIVEDVDATEGGYHTLCSLFVPNHLASLDSGSLTVTTKVIGWVPW